MKKFLLLLIFVGTQAFSFKKEWKEFKKLHEKVYRDNEEESHRIKAFKYNWKLIEEHNRKYEKGLVSYKLMMNHFGDMMNDEFRSLMNKFNSSKTPRVPNSENFNIVGDVPASIDWRQKGAVTPIKNQKQCGSCWAFSTTGALEGQYFLKNGKLVSLSEQNLVDCSLQYGNNGCGGGLMDNAFRYVRENGGIDTEASYPYKGVDEKCRFNKANVGATVNNLIDVPSGNENALKSAVGSVGPVSVAIDAGHISFQFYHKGVYAEKSCSSQELDHGVLVVGYGSENGKDYWLVKNSWSTKWGEEGFIKMSRNNNNNCGIASSASYPVV
nr:cathepsin L1-like [Halyomorpha halys]XP_024216457.1 cathepsin L1-like [Halyomorpha halys]